MTNRVDELESEIGELRAAVNGLTEELVETKARVRQLEEEAEARDAAEDGFVDAEPVETETTTKSDDHVEVVEQDPAAADPTQPADSASEGDNPTEAQESTDEDAEQGDIIIA